MGVVDLREQEKKAEKRVSFSQTGFEFMNLRSNWLLKNGNFLLPAGVFLSLLGVVELRGRTIARRCIKSSENETMEHNALLVQLKQFCLVQSIAQIFLLTSFFRVSFSHNHDGRKSS